MAEREMSYEELQQQFFQIRGQLEHQVMVNQELQKALGENAGKSANLQVAVNSLQEYAKQMEKRLAEMDQPKQDVPVNRAQRRKEQKTKPKSADDTAK